MVETSFKSKGTG